MWRRVKNAVAIAEAGRRGEVRYLGEVENSRAATRKLIAKLSKTYKRCSAATLKAGVRLTKVARHNARSFYP